MTRRTPASRICAIKLNGRHGTMRWEGIDFLRGDTAKRARGDRLCHFARVASEQVLAGTGRNFEVRVAGSKIWHPLTLDAAQAEAIVRKAHMGGRGGERAVQSLARTRAVLLERGLEPLS